jgi:hypothetical protein
MARTGEVGKGDRKMPTRNKKGKKKYFLPYLKYFFYPNSPF